MSLVIPGGYGVDHDPLNIVIANGFAISPCDEVKGLHAWALGDQHTNFSVNDVSESIAFGMTTFAFANKLI